MRETCDKCHTPIIDSRCSCGVWFEDSKSVPFLKTMENAVEAYNFICDQNNDHSPFSGDHHSGTCILLFKGDYIDCMRVKKYISEIRKEEL